MIHDFVIQGIVGTASDLERFGAICFIIIIRPFKSIWDVRSRVDHGVTGAWRFILVLIIEFSVIGCLVLVFMCLAFSATCLFFSPVDVQACSGPLVKEAIQLANGLIC